MSKIKKLVVLCFMMLLGGLIITNSVNAESKYFSYNDLCTNENLLCAQHHQKMSGATYDLIATINITGNKSTGNGTTVESWHNAKLASILSHPRGQGIIGGGDVENLPVQNAIWNYFGTWRSEVGYQHGISQDFINNEKGNYTPSIETEANTYADNYKEGSLTDKTDVDKIKVTSYKENNKNYLRIGPFKYKFTGTLSEIEVVTDKQSSMQIKSFEKCMKENEFKKYSKVEDIKSKDEFYISVKMPTDGSNQIKQIKVKNKTNVKHVEIKFWEDTGLSQQNLLEYTYNDQEVPIETPVPCIIKLSGNLKVIKVNKDNTTVKLPNVGFKIQNKDTEKWVVKEANGTISYVNSKNKATEFITDKNGEITIENLIVGTYVAYETINPNYGYEMITEGKEKDVMVDKTAKLQIPNKQKYIKLSGYVWVDDLNIAKSEDKDKLYNTSNAKDLLLNGITVRLKDKTTGEIVKDEKGNNMETTTSQLNRYTENGNNGNGEYLFEDVLIEKLSDYYIEFEYDGLTYTNVIPYVDRNNGSKAAESGRTTFNEKFSVVEGKTTDTGCTRDVSGKSVYNLEYDKTGKVATLSSDGDYEIVKDDAGNDLYINQKSIGQYTITANTDEAKYSIKDYRVAGEEEIRYINLGLYERDQPDISLEKDLYNVKISVNGKDHIYKYASRFKNAGVYEDGFNVGVEFGDETSDGKTSYSRAIYKSDYEYETNSDKELKVYVTYQLLMINQSSSLTAQINSIADYYDKRYTIVHVGTDKDDEKGTVTDDIAYDLPVDSGDYKKIIINNKTKLEAQKATSIYVQFQLSREQVATIISLKGENPEGELLKNVAEINSYSIYDRNGKVYAGIDTDSNPGNCTPGDESNYEDDTARCPGLQLEVAAEREMTGTVFVDSTSGELMTGQIRQGNGQYDAGETGIDGVEVTLIENSGSGRVYKTTTETTTDGKGNFKITGYIPGDYTLTYTWGDETYTVQDYKGTVYDYSRYNNNLSNKYWYKEETRYTDAIDNYNTDQEVPKGSRLQIDKEMSETTELTRTKMDSTTPTMDISVEYETMITNWNDNHTFSIKNIDFGIVERARQVLEVSKNVTGVKITLANGQVIVDAKIENGELKGTTAGVTYGPSDSTSKGFVKVEMDNELIQGATIQIEYTVTVANKSELDYDDEDYYKYGVQKGNVITMTPTGLYDYLDSEMVLDENNNNESWTTVNEDKTLENKTILSTENLKKEIKPGENNSIKLYTSKILANTDEIDLNNDFEVTEIKRTQDTGRIVNVESSYLYDQAESVTVTPPTGDDNNYLPYIILGITSCIILGAGVVFIKKKALR